VTIKVKNKLVFLFCKLELLSGKLIKSEKGKGKNQKILCVKQQSSQKKSASKSRATVPLKKVKNRSQQYVLLQPYPKMPKNRGIHLVGLSL